MSHPYTQVNSKLRRYNVRAELGKETITILYSISFWAKVRLFFGGKLRLQVRPGRIILGDVI